MSERSRGPEGASSPASTQSEPSGGDDIYAAAAASAAGRSAKRSASAKPARSAGSAPEAQTDGSSTAARAQPSDTPPAGSRTNGAQSNGSPSGSSDTANGQRGSSSGGQFGGGSAGAADNGAPRSAAAETDTGGEPTSKLSAVANSVLSRVRSTGKSDGAKGAPESNAQPTGAPAPSDKSASDKSPSDKSAAGKSAVAGAAAGAAATSATKNSATTVGGAGSTTADPANEPTTAMKRETLSPLPNSKAAGTEGHEAAAEQGRVEKPKAGTPRGTRKARLRLSRLDPWSVMKTAFLFSIAAGIVMVVAVYAVWLVIGSSGLFDSVDSIVGSVLQSPGDTTPFRIEDYVNTQKVMGVTAFLACIDVVIFTALVTLGSFLYNLAATMLGGLEVTLAED